MCIAAAALISCSDTEDVHHTARVLSGECPELQHVAHCKKKLRIPAISWTRNAVLGSMLDVQNNL